MTNETKPKAVQCENPDCRKFFLEHNESCPYCGAPRGLPKSTAMDKWDARFLSLAYHVSNWSKDPSTKVGAIIVDEERRILATGYNGLPRGVCDTEERINVREQKLPRTVHAELNAILSCTLRPKGGTIYVTSLPVCPSCATAIIQAGIKRVVMGIPASALERHWTQSFKEIVVDMFDEAGVAHELWEVDFE